MEIIFIFELLFEPTNGFSKFDMNCSVSLLLVYLQFTSLLRHLFSFIFLLF